MPFIHTVAPFQGSRTLHAINSFTWLVDVFWGVASNVGPQKCIWISDEKNIKSRSTTSSFPGTSRFWWSMSPIFPIKWYYEVIRSHTRSLKQSVAFRKAESLTPSAEWGGLSWKPSGGQNVDWCWLVTTFSRALQRQCFDMWLVLSEDIMVHRDASCFPKQ